MNPFNWSSELNPIRFWTADHWLNFGIFIGGAVTAVGITATTSWGAVPALFTPATTIGFIISIMGFLRASLTDKARNPTLGSRSTDPNPTERVVGVGPVNVGVPPVTPGRPLDPDAPKP